MWNFIYNWYVNYSSNSLTQACEWLVFSITASTFIYFVAFSFISDLIVFSIKLFTGSFESYIHGTNSSCDVKPSLYFKFH